MKTADQHRSISIDGRTFDFVYRPSRPGDPLLVVLHGHSKSPRASKLESPHFNVLCPVDNFGLKGFGSWYLGEQGDFFWLKAMPAIISSVRDGQDLYFAGSSMGGYGAILHGTLNRAKGVYANIPQTKLLHSTYATQGMGAYFRHILAGQTSAAFNDLKTVITDDVTTHFDITAIRWDKPGYLQEQILDFVAALTSKNVSFTFEVFNGTGHGLTIPMHEAADRILAKTLAAQTDPAASNATTPAAQDAAAPRAAAVTPAPATTDTPPAAGPDAGIKATALLRDIVLVPENFWQGPKAHMAGRFSGFLTRYGKKLSTEDRSLIADDIVAKVARRRLDRPDTIFVINAGSCGSHWLQAVIHKHFRASPCGEVYFPDKGMAFLKTAGDGDRADFIDGMHLAHCYDGAEVSDDMALINTAHASGWPISAAMPDRTFRIALIRDPVDVAISRTFRKPAHREKFFGSLTDEEYLATNVTYLENFYRHFKAENIDHIVRYEDMRSDMPKVLQDLENSMKITKRGARIADTVAFFSDVKGATTNKFSGPQPEIPTRLRDKAASDLVNLRTKLGYIDGIR